MFLPRTVNQDGNHEQLRSPSAEAGFIPECFFPPIYKDKNIWALHTLMLTLFPLKFSQEPNTDTFSVHRRVVEEVRASLICDTLRSCNKCTVMRTVWGCVCGPLTWIQWRASRLARIKQTALTNKSIKPGEVRGQRTNPNITRLGLSLLLYLHTDLDLNKRIFPSQCLHEMIVEHSTHIPVYMRERRVGLISDDTPTLHSFECTDRSLAHCLRYGSMGKRKEPDHYCYSAFSAT